MWDLTLSQEGRHNEGAEANTEVAANGKLSWPSPACFSMASPLTVEKVNNVLSVDPHNYKLLIWRKPNKPGEWFYTLCQTQRLKQNSGSDVGEEEETNDYVLKHVVPQNYLGEDQKGKPTHQMTHDPGGLLTRAFGNRSNADYLNSRKPHYVDFSKEHCPLLKEHNGSYVLPGFGLVEFCSVVSTSESENLIAKITLADYKRKLPETTDPNNPHDVAMAMLALAPDEEYQIPLTNDDPRRPKAVEPYDYLQLSILRKTVNNRYDFVGNFYSEDQSFFTLDTQRKPNGVKPIVLDMPVFCALGPRSQYNAYYHDMLKTPRPPVLIPFQERSVSDQTAFVVKEVYQNSKSPYLRWLLEQHYTFVPRTESDKPYLDRPNEYLHKIEASREAIESAFVTVKENAPRAWEKIKGFFRTVGGNFRTYRGFH